MIAEAPTVPCAWGSTAAGSGWGVRSCTARQIMTTARRAFSPPAATDSARLAGESERLLYAPSFLHRPARVSHTRGPQNGMDGIARVAQRSVSLEAAYFLKVGMKYLCRGRLSNALNE